MQCTTRCLTVGGLDRNVIILRSGRISDTEQQISNAEHITCFPTAAHVRPEWAPKSTCEEIATKSNIVCSTWTSTSAFLCDKSPNSPKPCKHICSQRNHPRYLTRNDIQVVVSCQRGAYLLELGHSFPILLTTHTHTHNGFSYPSSTKQILQ